MYKYIFIYLCIYILYWIPKSTGVAEFGVVILSHQILQHLHVCLKPRKKHHEMPKQMPSREPSYPTLGKGKSSTQKCRLVEDMLVPGRVTHGVQTWNDSKHCWRPFVTFKVVVNFEAFVHVPIKKVEVLQVFPNTNTCPATAPQIP